MARTPKVRNLVFVLGDQLDVNSAAFDEFGQYQDAMWTDQPYLYHSRISAALNMKLLDPRDVIDSAVAAYHAELAPLNAVEGFVRQILGWREYVRGVYWRFMPEYLERNTLKAKRPLPEFYWTAETDMNCLRETISQTLDYGYAHHIQRLMVTGLFALLLGVDPKEVHQWYLAVYVDAVEWVELPNVLGMSQFADDGVMASKPYAATGKYIQRMSNYCGGCRFRPENARRGRVSFHNTVLGFPDAAREVVGENQRMSLQVKNLKRKSADERGRSETAADCVITGIHRNTELIRWSIFSNSTQRPSSDSSRSISSGSPSWLVGSTANTWDSCWPTNRTGGRRFPFTCSLSRGWSCSQFPRRCRQVPCERLSSWALSSAW